jgi:shikimate dehydrogenase
MREVIRVGLLGLRIEKSQSKNLHELIGELYGIPVSYQPLDMAGRKEKVSVCDELERCSRHGYRGLNVTHPYKREAYRVVKTPAQLPRGLTSINTVLFEREGFLGDNTDFSGFIQAFQNSFGSGCTPGRVLLIGAGGVGVAIALALFRLGAEEIVIHDTCMESAETLVRLVSDAGGVARLAVDDLPGEMGQANGLVNCTPIGMYQYPGNPLPVVGTGGQDWAFDAVYTPQLTRFLAECRRKSIPVLSGFRLFLYQGLHAFRLFTGFEPDATRVEDAFFKRFPEVFGGRSPI